MIVGILRVELFIPESSSLKSKRFVIKSIKTRMSNRFNVSVAEVGGDDKWQRTSLGIATVSNDRRLIDSTFSQILNSLLKDGRVEVLDQQIEIV